jgi:hypothetical protein
MEERKKTLAMVHVAALQVVFSEMKKNDNGIICKRNVRLHTRTTSVRKVCRILPHYFGVLLKLCDRGNMVCRVLPR